MKERDYIDVGNLARLRDIHSIMSWLQPATPVMDTFLGVKVFQSPHVQPVPVITFDPKRLCTWATPEYRASVDAWLLERFGKMEVAYMFDPRALGLPGSPGFLLNPKHAAMLKNYSRGVVGDLCS